VRIAQRVEDAADANRAKALTEDELASLVAETPDEWSSSSSFSP